MLSIGANEEQGCEKKVLLVDVRSREKKMKKVKRKEQKKQNKNTSIRSKQLEARGVSMDMETSWAAQEMTSTFSDLNNMARFQQKQLQEKEQKLLQLYDQQQQRAYQVVQRGSAGSNGSNHSSSINQHTVTKTTTTSHTTSTSHGGKVRQMFDERRQTTVKGIDRSYPLEPLENKPRKQTNENVAQKNGNLTVNRQSVTVKRVARADVNSNLNGGKPMVSYHEEITRDSYGPAGRPRSDDDEFGNENHINQYANGNETHIGEVLDEDTIERNRMMAKLHLMQYDETLKHRVKNDLESEEFPVDYMVDVPDKLPKRTVTKKLSQAEARLERFKNANAKRSNSVTKNPSTVLKKRSDPIFPAKSTSSGDRGKTRTRQIFDRGSTRGNTESNVVSPENVDDGSLSSTEKSTKRKNEDNMVYYKEGEKLMSSDIHKELRASEQSASPKLVRKQSGKSVEMHATNAKYREKSPGSSKNIPRRSDGSNYFDSNTGRKSADQLLKNRAKRSENPKFFCEESEKSATTYAIDSKTREKLSPDFSTNIKQRSESSDVKQNLSSKLSKNIEKRSASPKYFCKESETSATTYAIDSKTREKLSPDFSTSIQQRSQSPDVKQNLSSKLSKNIEKRSASPKYFCKESETSATTYAIDSKTREKLSPDFSTNILRRSESPEVKQNLSSKLSKNIEKRSASPKYLCKESETIIKRSESPKLYRKASEKPVTTFATDSKSAKQLTSKSPMKDKQRSESPKYFSGETKKSATTYAIGSRSRSATPDFVKIDPMHSENVSQRNDRKTETEVNKKSTSNKMPNVFERLTRDRSASPKSVHATASKRIKSAKTPDSTKKVPRKRNESPEITKSKSPSFARQLDGRSSTSPQFFGSDSETSATIMLVTPETILKKRPESNSHRSKTYKTDNTVTELKRTMSEEIVDASSKQSIRNSVSRFFTEQCEKASRNLQANKGSNVRSEVTDKNRRWSRDSSPLSLKDLRTTGPRSSEKPISSIDSSRDWSSKSRRSSINPSPEPSGNKIVPTGTEIASMHRSKQPIVKKSRSPENLKSANKTTDRVHANVLRSTRLIREAINRNNRTYVDDVDKRDSKGHRRTCIVDENDAGISDGEKDEKCRKIDERSRTPSCKMFESPATESSPKSSTSVEVDAEIQEITMPDQYIQHQPREVRSRSRDKTPDCGRSSTEKLFTYSVRKPARKRGSLFESNVFELSRKDQGKTDRRETSGRKERVSSECTVKNGSPTTDSLTFRGSKCSAEEKQQAKTETDDFKIDRKKVHDDIKGTKRNWSSSPSPTSDLTFRGSKSSIKENKEIRRGSRTNLDECRKRESDNIRRIERDWSNSPSPTRDLTFRGYKHPSKKSEEIIRKTETRSSGSPEKKVPGEYQREKHDNLKCKERDYSHSHRTNNMTFRVYKRSFEKNDGVDRKIRTGVSNSPERIILDEYNEEKYDDFRHTQEHLSSSPSPTDSSTFRRSKPESDKNTKTNRETKVEISRSQTKSVSDKRNEGKSDNIERRQRSWSSSPSPTSNLTVRGSKRVTKSITKKDKSNIQGREQRTNDSRKTEGTKCTNRSKSSDPNAKRKVSEPATNRKSEIREKSSSTRKRTSSKSPEVKESEILRSMELVRRVIKGGASKQEETIKTAISNESVENKDTDVKKSDSAGTMKIETRKSSSTIVYLNDETSSSHYERTDSVESALRRFDSIGTVSVQSITEKRQTAEESRNDSKAISLKALDRIDANLPQGITNVPSLRSTTVVSEETNENGSETRCRRKYARVRDSIEIARIVMGSKTPGCKRKLFPDDGEAENGSSRSRQASAKIGDDVLEKSDSNMGSRRLEKESIVAGDKSGNEDGETSTGVTLHLSVKQLRSIDDIRKSIDSVETKGTSSESVIANETLKRSDATRSGRLPSRRTDVDGNKKVTILPKRSENITAKKHGLGDRERSSIKCAIRFSRVTKSPSPDSTKTTESSGRARRNVLASPSKSPDTVTAARRPSTELKAQEARSTKRPTLIKGAEPIGNRKTATTTTTRKSTDVVDGAILENGVHLRDQTAETKYDNDSSATKKSDAFVVDFDEQPPKENDAPVPRKSLLRKQSTDKQIPSTPSGRPPSSVSSISSGSSMQCQVSGSRSKMASKAKAPSGTAYRGSPSSKSGGSAVVADSLVPCKICGRRFAQDRVTLHEQICTKTAQKKRKQFDAMLYRVRGTELEPFVKKGLCKKQPEKLKKTEPKSNWRRKHEDFINAIRSAKQVQAHLAAGGKLSDLPPPPASDTSDYIQCPHCGRKFNQSAAERHIPKCENMLHNKPVHSRAPKPKR